MIRQTATAGPNGTGTVENGARVPGARRRIFIPVGVGVALVAAIAAALYFVNAAHHVTTDDAQIAGNITTVSPRVKGELTKVLVDDNRHVRKGDILVTLDDHDYRVAVEQAQAAYEQAVQNARAAADAVPLQSVLTSAQTSQAEAQREQATSGVSAAVARVGAARGAVAAAQQQVAVARAAAGAAAANLRKAQADYARAQTLAAQGAISQSQLDAARAAFQGAQAQAESSQASIRAALAGVVQAQDNLLQAQAGIAQAQAQVAAGAAGVAQAQAGNQQSQIRIDQARTGAAAVQAAKATLDAAKLQLSYTVVRAPIDGIVSKKAVNVGDVVSAGQPLMAIADRSRLWVIANLRETQLNKVAVGQTVRVHVDAFPNERVTGKVEGLAPATGSTFALIPPDNATGNFTKVVQRVPVRIAIDPASDPRHVLREGLSVEVDIDTASL